MSQPRARRDAMKWIAPMIVALPFPPLLIVYFLGW